MKTTAIAFCLFLVACAQRSEGENPATCDMDTRCEPANGENASNCASDCGGTNPPACDLDMVCDTGEVPASCTDCVNTNPCGDGTCSGGETYESCPADCGGVPTNQVTWWARVGGVDKVCVNAAYTACAQLPTSDPKHCSKLTSVSDLAALRAAAPATAYAVGQASDSKVLNAWVAPGNLHVTVSKDTATCGGDYLLDLAANGFTDGVTVQLNVATCFDPNNPVCWNQGGNTPLTGPGTHGAGNLAYCGSTNQSGACASMGLEIVVNRGEEPMPTGVYPSGP